MKKFSLTVVLVILAVTCAVSLTGCGGSAAPQRMLGTYAPWKAQTTETSVYDVELKTDDGIRRGVYTIDVTRNKNAAYAIGDVAYEAGVFTGIYAKAVLAMENGDSVENEALFDTNLVPIAARTLTLENGQTSELIAKYDTKKYYFTIKDGEGNVVKEDSIKHKKFDTNPYYDNSMCYLVARCLPDTSASFAFKIAQPQTGKMTAVNISRTTSDNLKLDAFPMPGDDGEDVGVKCTQISLNVSKSFPRASTPFKCNVSIDPINGAAHVLLRIVESKTYYTLKSVTITSHAV